jgi:hypothetical protein
MSAIAYTVGAHLVFREGAFAPGTNRGRLLFAHELAHVIQNGGTGGRIQRQVAPEAAVELLSQAPVPPLPLAPPATIGDLRAREPEAAAMIERLRTDYGRLSSRAEPVLVRIGAASRNPLDNLLYRRADQQVTTYWNVAVGSKAVDAAHLSMWLDHVEGALVSLGNLRPVLELGSGASEDAVLETARLELLGRVTGLRATLFLREGTAAREREEKRARAKEKIASAVSYIESYVRPILRTSTPVSDQAGHLHGANIAQRLVVDMGLNADEVRDVLDSLKARDRVLYQAALMRGGTVESLLELGIGGLQAYRADGEGLFAGFVRGSRESLLSNAPHQKVLSIPEVAIAVGGFIAGAVQGVVVSVANNVVAIVDIINPFFWGEIVKVVTEDLPKFIKEEDVRFALGQALGIADTEETRRLAEASPIEYGRSYGYIFGMALTEIVLAVVGLGIVIKAVTASKLLQRLSKPLTVVADVVAKTALARRGIKAVQGLAEIINALGQRLRRLSALLPDITANRRVSRAIFDLQEKEWVARTALERGRESERLARAAMAAGEEAEAERRAREMKDTIDQAESVFQQESLKRGGLLFGSIAPLPTPPLTPKEVPLASILKPSVKPPHTGGAPLAVRLEKPALPPARPPATPETAIEISLAGSKQAPPGVSFDIHGPPESNPVDLPSLEVPPASLDVSKIPQGILSKGAEGPPAMSELAPELTAAASRAKQLEGAKASADAAAQRLNAASRRLDTIKKPLNRYGGYPGYTMEQRIAEAEVERAEAAKTLAEAEVRGLEGPEFFAYRYEDLGGPAPCFVPGTVVKTPDGDRPIEAFSEGDCVLSMDLETERQTTGRVLGVRRNWTERIVRVGVGEAEIVATSGHPFWLPELHLWRAAGRLRVGDRLTTPSGPAMVTSLRTEDRLTATVNLEVSTWHNFYAGHAGILVHNGTEGLDLERAATLHDSKIYGVVRTYPDGSKQFVYVGKTWQETIMDRFEQHMAAKGWTRPEYEAVELRRKMMTDYETAVWEAHFTKRYELQNRAAGRPVEGQKYILNEVDQITKARFAEGKGRVFENPCR